MSIHEEYAKKIEEILDTCMERIKEADGALALAAMNSAVDAADRERISANDRILASGSQLLLKRRTYEEMVEQRKREEAEECIPGTGEDAPDVPENCTVGRHPEYAGQKDLRLTDKRGAWLTDWDERGYCARSRKA